LLLGADWDPVVEVGDIAGGVTASVTRRGKNVTRWRKSVT
jgi:hypothetical protein